MAYANPKKRFLKLVILGSSDVGKTSILHRLKDNEFREDYMPTVGMNFSHIFIGSNEKQYDISLWDTAGHEQYRSLPSAFLRDADLAIIVFSLTDRQSFDTLADFFSLIESVKSPCIVQIFGNKSDLPQPRVVEEREAAGYSAQYGSLYREVSAKSGLGISDAIYNLVEAYEQKNPEPQPKIPHSESVPLDIRGGVPQRKTCC